MMENEDFITIFMQIHSGRQNERVPPCTQSVNFITVTVKQRSQVSLGKIRLMSIMAGQYLPCSGVSGRLPLVETGKYSLI